MFSWSSEPLGVQVSKLPERQYISFGSFFTTHHLQLFPDKLFFSPWLALRQEVLLPRHFLVFLFSAVPWFVRRLAKVLCSNVHHSGLPLFQLVIARIEQRALVCQELHLRVYDNHPRRRQGSTLLPSKHLICQRILGIPGETGSLLEHE